VAIAHAAEVTCHTGLGDVGAQNFGGLVIGVRPGPPPWGKWRRIRTPKDVKVVCCTLGTISTSRLLREADFCERVKALGISAMRKLLRDPTPANFMEVSSEFSEKLGLMDDELRSLIEAAEDAGALGASQIMIGRAVFALAKRGDAARIRRAFLELTEAGETIVTGIDLTGASLYSGFRS
jgi:pantoate kinase